MVEYDMRRAFFGCRFWGGVVFSCLIGIGGARAFLNYVQLNGTVGQVPIFLQASIEGMHSDLFLLVIPIIGPQIYSAVFMEEIRSRFYLFSMSRLNKRKYFLSKAITTFIAGGGCILVGSVLLPLFICIYQPPLQSEVKEIVDHASKYLILYLGQIILVFLSGGFWSLFGGISTVIMKSSFMAYTTPFVFYYIMSAFQERYYYNFPYFSPKILARGEGLTKGQDLLFLTVLSISGILCYVFLMNRRVDHE